MSVIAKLDQSFKKATKGEESLNIMIWYWGVIAYLVSFFIINKGLKQLDINFINITISILTTAYFIWHIYATKKCAPKKPKLSKAEKKQRKIENRESRSKSFMRKLLLQEPITKWNSVTVVIVIDLICIAHFLERVI